MWLVTVARVVGVFRPANRTEMFLLLERNSAAGQRTRGVPHGTMQLLQPRAGNVRCRRGTIGLVAEIIKTTERVGLLIVVDDALVFWRWLLATPPCPNAYKHLMSI